MGQTVRSAGRNVPDSRFKVISENLATVHVDVGGTVEQRIGTSVEPLYLQIVGHELWESASEGQMLQGNIEIIKFDVALSKYFDDVVSSVASGDENYEASLRWWIQSRLITNRGFRAQVTVTSGPDPNALLSSSAGLVDTGIIRREEARGTTWVELAHDRFVAPILVSNEDWFANNKSAWVPQALRWEQRHRRLADTP